MSTPGTSTVGPEGPEFPPASEVGGPITTSAGPIRPGRLWAFGLIGAVAAGLAAFAVVEAIPTPFHPPPRMVSVPFATGLVNQPTDKDVRSADLKNAMVTFGLLGGSLALVLGLAGGLARGAARAGLVGAGIGLVLGAVAAAGAATIAVPFYQRQSAQNADAMSQDLALPMLVHAGLWAAIGIAAGVALAIGAGARGRLVPVALAGMIGGVLGAALYEVTAALLSPDGKTYQPIASAWPPRLLAATVCPILVALVAASALGASARRAKGA